VLRSDDAAGFARLTEEMASEPDLVQTVHRVIELAPKSIPGCDFAGFTLTHPDRLETAVATDDVVVDLDRAQHELGEGPCLSAARSERTYEIRDTRTDPRWPAWAGRAAQAGVRSVLSVQLTGLNHLPAAMNLYSHQVDAFDEEAVATALIFATHAGNAIASSEEAEQLRTALRSRHTIGLAQGMLMHRFGLSEDRSFRFLSRLSQDSNTKLRDVAAKVIEEGQNEDARTKMPERLRAPSVVQVSDMHPPDPHLTEDDLQRSPEQDPDEHRRSSARLQEAVNEVVASCAGRSLDEAVSAMVEAVARRGQPPQPDRWVEAVATGAIAGRTYVVSQEALEDTGVELPALGVLGESAGRDRGQDPA
jgi:putative methionine-R-sulfoxide reductase with GAF domain